MLLYRADDFYRAHDLCDLNLLCTVVFMDWIKVVTVNGSALHETYCYLQDFRYALKTLDTTTCTLRFSWR